MILINCNFATPIRYYSIVLTGHVLRRLDLSNMTHHRPLVRGDVYALISSELGGEKCLLPFTFWPVYMLADDSCMNHTR